MQSSKGPKLPKHPHVVPLREMFEAYCDLDSLSELVDVDALPFSQLQKWMIRARVIDNLQVTVTDAFLCFFQFKKRAISYEEFLFYLDDLVETKSLNLNEVKYKLQTCGKPSFPRNSS